MNRSIPRHVLFLFLDGVGLGRPVASVNPFCSTKYPALEQLSDGRPWILETDMACSENRFFSSLDATLGMPGLPQSGTGQATLLTGINCAKIVGRHFGPFPHSAIRPVIAQYNIFRQLAHIIPEERDGLAFANAYPRRFFDFVKQRNRWTVTTLCCIEAGVRPSGLDEVLSGKAVTADLTGQGWNRIGYHLDPISPEQAGSRLLSISRRNRFTLFEYYLTDKAGHSRNMQRAVATLESVDACIRGILADFDVETDLLILTSDHGNIEDMSTKVHTLNRVPFAAYGASADSFTGMTSIQDVTPRIVSVLNNT